jgi:UDP-glucuronate 4-epimerase
VPRTYASPDLLEALTDFKPSTPLEEGVARFAAWYQEFYETGAKAGAETQD